MHGARKTRVSGSRRNCRPARPSAAATRMTEKCTIVLFGKQSVLYRIDRNCVHSQWQLQFRINIIVIDHPPPFCLRPCVPRFLAALAHSSFIKIYTFSHLPNPPKCIRLLLLQQQRYDIKRLNHHPSHHHHFGYWHQTANGRCGWVGPMAQFFPIGHCRAQVLAQYCKRLAAPQSNELYAPCSTRCHRHNRCAYLWTRLFESTRRLTLSAPDDAMDASWPTRTSIKACCHFPPVGPFVVVLVHECTNQSTYSKEMGLFTSLK
jgi:hypothetical protein